MTINSHGAEDPGQAWITWLNEHESLEISEWLLRWADAQPDRSETFPSWKRKLIDRCDAKYRLAATEIDQLRETLERVTKERDAARRLACGALASGGSDLLNDPYLFKDDGRIFMAHDEASARGWDCFKSDHIGEPNEMDPKP